jgi:hypothetical protein
MTLKLGDANDTVLRWRQVMAAMFGGTTDHPGLYARLHGPLPTNTNVFGARAQAWQEEYERRTGQTVDGEVSDQDLLDLHVVVPYRPIWCYSAPGSGVPWNVGPPFDLGEKCKNILHLNHQPVGYPIGGYMGFLGGDPKYSYNDIIGLLAAELERLLGVNPDVQKAMAARRADPHAAVDVELWFLGYSQSADGIKRAVERLFGPGGRYELIRDRINGVIAFGDPSKPNTGIARLVYQPAPWLTALTHSITNESPTPDFYAEATDNIRPLFYEWIVQAATSLSFVEYSAKIVIPAMLNLVGAAFPGGLALTSPLAVPVLAGASGLAPGLISTLVGAVLATNEQPDPKLIEFLSVQGILTNLPALVGLLLATPGIAVHGDYYAPKPEFGGRSGFDVGYDIIAGFRR